MKQKDGYSTEKEDLDEMVEDKEETDSEGIEEEEPLQM